MKPVQAAIPAAFAVSDPTKKKKKTHTRIRSTPSVDDMTRRARLQDVATLNQRTCLFKLIHGAAGGYTTEHHPNYVKVIGKHAPVEALLHANGDSVVLDYGTHNSIPAVYPSLDIACANLTRRPFLR